jgi:hypothetical protein
LLEETGANNSNRGKFNDLFPNSRVSFKITGTMPDYEALYKIFLASGNSLQVYKGNKLLFTSDKEMLAPLLEYIETTAPEFDDVIIFDKIMGNAAALLCVIAKCREVYSPLGSEPAVKTLEKSGISHHITTIVPFIQKPTMNDLCPMEKLSLGKTPDEFYQLLKSNKQKASC